MVERGGRSLVNTPQAAPAHSMPSPDGTMETFGSFPAFSLRRLGRVTGLGIRRLEDTRPRLCRPPLPPGGNGNGRSGDKTAAS